LVYIFDRTLQKNEMIQETLHPEVLGGGSLPHEFVYTLRTDILFHYVHIPEDKLDQIVGGVELLQNGNPLAVQAPSPHVRFFYKIPLNGAFGHRIHFKVSSPAPFPIQVEYEPYVFDPTTPLDIGFDSPIPALPGGNWLDAPLYLVLNSRGVTVQARMIITATSLVLTRDYLGSRNHLLSYATAS
jgi:hypothetical protein